MTKIQVNIQLVSSNLRMMVGEEEIVESMNSHSTIKDVIDKLNGKARKRGNWSINTAFLIVAVNNKTVRNLKHGLGEGFATPLKEGDIVNLKLLTASAGG